MIVSSFPNDLHQHPLAAAAVELAVEDLLPGAEIEPAIGDGHHHLPAHDLPFQVGVGVVLPDVVAVLRHRGMGGQSLQPEVIVVVQARFIVIDEDRRRDVHRVAEKQSFADAAFPEALLHLRGDVEEGPAAGDAEPEFLAVALHG